ncbi:uncharacterized protein LOC117386624 [Periophthalmus magnuspinnatus]|uniref:uncharacterized protein LOC117386624 n=1 Tax=Periophthalmus magnuspinnatus TaxID=409849 RepID=UPI0024373558|nr:uncharacterized protein LOC117386624 [Periophthalmus magnuspinnatus]
MNIIYINYNNFNSDNKDINKNDINNEINNNNINDIDNDINISTSKYFIFKHIFFKSVHAFIYLLNRPVISLSVSDGASQARPQGVRVLLGSKFRVKCSVEPQYPGGSFQLLSPTAPLGQNHTLPAVNHSAHFLFSDTGSAHKGNYTCVYHLHVFNHNFSSQSPSLQLSLGAPVSDLIIRVLVILLLKLLYILPMFYYYCKVRARGGR